MSTSPTETEDMLLGTHFQSFTSLASPARDSPEDPDPDNKDDVQSDSEPLRMWETPRVDMERRATEAVAAQAPLSSIRSGPQTAPLTLISTGTEGESLSETQIEMSANADDGAGAVHGKDKVMMKRFSWKQLGAGLMDDIRTRLIPYYISDFRDAFDTQCLSSIIFIFFACLTPAITFGGVMGISTGGRIGVIEMLLGTSLGGIIYSLFSAQPLVVLGGTGPLLIFTQGVMKLCDQFNLDFLAVYPWIGIWISIFTTICVLTNASQLVKYFTRFTEDAFAALIAFIFLLGAFTSLHNLRLKFPLEKYPNIFLESVVLMFGTFALALFLRGTHSSRFGTRIMRSFLSKFAMPITIVTMILLEAAIHGDPPMLKVLPKLSPTYKGRPWFIPLGQSMEAGRNFPAWAPFAAALPGLFGTALIFMDQQITGVLINSPTNGLKKPPGYHLDLLICAGVILLCSLLGFPWMVGATVRSIAHEQSLTRYEVTAKSVEYKKTVQSPPPEKDEEAAGVSTSDAGKAPQTLVMAMGKIVPKTVLEQRVSSLGVHILIGLVAFFGRKAMSYIPLPVLYGIFLYMGVTATNGNQLVDRCLILLMDSGMRPNEPYVLHCSYWVIAKFTFIQLASIVVLILIQRSSIAIVFPLLTISLVPLRWSLARFRIFTPKELELLDSH
eukprot:gb/GEZN01001157.1/.p1 GENE.gb/GEZN01001157.1/~~gb/GEZN01001157.1/.p1  ORF type:complete len:668 (-),score=71.98 gb/GEZN01001157.1/:637-2640(-)